MSSLYVRKLAKVWATAGPVPFVDTVNLEEDPRHDVWCTIQWMSGSNEVLDYCRNTVERASFQLVFFGKPGIGDEILLEQAELGLLHIMAQSDNAKKLQLMGAGVPEDFSIGNHFGVQFIVDYEYTK
jgi:hypothetical protein